MALVIRLMLIAVGIVALCVVAALIALWVDAREDRLERRWLKR